MSAPQFDRQKGCFTNECIGYMKLPKRSVAYRTRWVDYGGNVSKYQGMVQSSFVARLLLNLGHVVQ